MIRLVEYKKHKQLLEIINVTSKAYNKKFKLHYVTLPQPNPAWCLGSDLYINNAIKVNPLYLPGIVAHELGHAISGVSNYTLLASLKPSTLISKTLYSAHINANDSSITKCHFLKLSLRLARLNGSINLTFNICLDKKYSIYLSKCKTLATSIGKQ